jgi:proteasome accessory factor PafA2
MNAAAICGLETEYGLMIEAGDLGQEEAALALLQRCPLAERVPWDAHAESPGRDARDWGRAEVSATEAADPASAPGYLLANGARLYVDSGHPEYSTPECAAPMELLRADRAGELVLERCRQELNRFLPPGHAVRLIKNNVDYQGHSYACHENYLVTAASYQALFSGRGPLLSQLVPFLVSRIVVCGAGKIGSGNGRPATDFQISQRADFFEELVGLQTMSRRPIVNTRDEPHCDRRRFRRLHVITGDSNMSQVATYLKVGTLQLLLCMLDQGATLPDFTLADPLAALLAISHDATCSRRVQLADGRRLTAVEMQLAFAEAVQRFADRGAAPAWAVQVIERWTGVLHGLKDEPRQLASTLDWVIKLELLDRWRQRKRLPWSAAELRELDIRYHDIDRDSGIFYRLEAAGAVARITDEEDVLRAVESPPAGTRAAVRSALLRAAGGRVIAGSWGELVWQQDGQPPRRIELADPAAGLDGTTPSWLERLERLERLEPGP